MNVSDGLSPPPSDPLLRDRSVVRSRRRAGDISIDGRGRVRGAPAFLSYGFRPFFLGAAIHAAVAVPLWTWIYLGGGAPGGPFSGSAWHAHEMIFGFLAAVMAGFALTAVPNWTGRLPLSGGRLGVLVLLWAIGRIATSTVENPLATLLLDAPFLIVLSLSIWREVVAGRNWRNAPIAGLFTLMAAANLLHHLEGLAPALEGTAVRLSLSVAALMIGLIGGRIVPSFTRNWLVKQGSQHLPAPFGALDKAALITTLAGLVAWNAAPDHIVSGGLLLAAGLLLAGRLSRWQGWRTWREPIVLVLHVGYLWLAAALALLGWSILAPEVIPQGAALHALTAGAVGSMTLAVMTRASRGHTGRTIFADGATLAIYVAVTTGALLRVAVPLAPDIYSELLTAGAALWSLAFALFALRYAPMLLRANQGQGRMPNPAPQ